MIIDPLSKLYSDNLKLPYPVSWIGGGVKPSPSTLSKYFYFQVESGSGKVWVVSDSNTPTKTDIEYSLDGTNWIQGVFSGRFININVVQGDKVYFRTTSGWNYSIVGDYKFGANVNVSVHGDIRSIIDYRDESITDIPNFCFTYLFGGCYSNLLSVDDNIFSKLLNIGEYGLYSAFSSCDKLQKSPTLPFETLSDHCFDSMFVSCSMLNEVTSLAKNGIGVGDSTNRWLIGASASGTFKCPQESVASYSQDTNGIPSGWTIVNI